MDRVQRSDEGGIFIHTVTLLLANAEMRSAVNRDLDGSTAMRI